MCLYIFLNVKCASEQTDETNSVLHSAAFSDFTQLSARQDVFGLQFVELNSFDFLYLYK